MTLKFDKDAWILEALAAKHIRVRASDGQIFRCRREWHGLPVAKPVKYTVHKKSGRIRFTLTFKGITKTVLVNRVVGLALLPNPDNLPEVNHKDGVKAHNWPSNLEWSSRKDQEKHAFKTGLKATRGSQNSNAKLTAASVQKIRLSNQSPVQLAELYGVSVATIKSVIARKTWSHI